MRLPNTMNDTLLLRHTGWVGRGLGVLIGAFGVLGHAPFHIWPIALLSLAILYLRLQAAAKADRPGRAGFSVGLWWALGYFAAGTFWVGSAFIERGPEFIPIMPFMVAGLAFVLAIFWGVAGGFLARTRVSGLFAVLVFAAAFTLAEMARGHAFGGFPWNLPAYVFEAGSRPSQFARWVGAYGLSALVLFIAAALGQAVFKSKRLGAILMAVLPLGGIYAYGHARLASAELEFHPDINLRIVSVPFRQADMMDRNSSIEITNDFIRAGLAPGLKDVTHLVWPEGAVRGFGRTAMENPDLLGAMGGLLAQDDPTPPVWLMNSLQTEWDQDRLRYYNASVAVSFDTAGRPTVAAYNRKRKLVAFGEHIPFMDWFDDVQFPLISTNLASISPAKSKTLADFPGLPRLSPQLCYEVAFPGLMPQDLENPAEFILNQSNDAWFGGSSGPAQHANIARYRAIETGLPIVRAASNGVSAVIDPFGRLHGKVEVKLMSHLDTKLPKSLNLKGYIKLTGFWLLLISLSTCVISSFVGRRGVGLRRQL